MTTTSLDTAITPARDSRIHFRLVADTRYVLTGFPVALVSLIVCLTAFTAGLGLAVAGIGIPLAAAAMMWARGFATTERARVAPVLGRALPQPTYRAATSAALPGRLTAVLADPRSWRDLAHATLRFIPNTIAFTFVATWWTGVIGGLTWGLWGWALPKGDVQLPELLGFGDSYLTIVGFYLLVAVFFSVTLPVVARQAARLEARFAESLLGTR